MIATFTMTENEKKDLSRKIEEIGLKEFGIYGRPLLEVWNEQKQMLEPDQKIEFIVGLDNSDLQGHLLELINEDPEKILQGIRIASDFNSAHETKLFLPKYNQEIIEKLKSLAKEYSVELVHDMIDVRTYEVALYCHLSVALNIFDIYHDTYYSGVYASVDGRQLQYIKPDEHIEDLIEIDTNALKAIEIGYATYPLDKLNQPISNFEITNGHIRTIKKDECIVDNTMRWLHKYQESSCGKCVFCREGLIQIEHITRSMTKGKGDIKALELMQEIGNLMPEHNLCTLGQKAPMYMLSAVENLNEEFQTHIKKNQCQADVCQALNSIYIDPHLCIGCGECVDVCPEDCIEGRAKYIHMIDEFDCTRCGECIKVCEENAIIKTSDRLPKLPTRLTKVGRFKKK